MDMIAEASMRLKWGHDDYEIAKQQIHTYIGDLSDIEVFGRQVLVAAYVRPDQNGSIRMTKGAQAEDYWQGKAVMILKSGPSAFQGTDGGEYEKSQFGENVRPPGPNDWVFMQASAGLQVFIIGEGGHRIQGETRHGDKYDLFEWDGWPCRLVGDDNFLGRLLNPTNLV